MMSETRVDTQAWVPESRNLVQLLQSAVARHAHRPLLGVRQRKAWQWWTYRQCAELVDALRAGLTSLGVGPGDRVAIITNNCPEWVICAYATYTLGACYVPMYASQLARDWQYILADSGAKICFVANQAIATQLEALRSALPELQTIVRLDAPQSEPHSYAALLATGRSKPVPPAQPDDDTLAAMIYTSGTTGKPKGVMLTHYNMASNACGSVGVVDVTAGDRSVAFLPWAHVFGGGIELNGAIAHGCCCAVCGEPTQVVGMLPEVKPSVLFGVPRVWNRIYNGVHDKMARMPSPVQALFQRALHVRSLQRRRQRLDLADVLVLKLAQRTLFPVITKGMGGQLRCVFSGAAKLSLEVAEFLENLGIPVYDGYGMTEASGCITANPRGHARAGSVGIPIAGVRIEIDQHVTGAGPDEGEIIVHGPGVMRGYWKQEELTRNTLTPNGGLRTGDLGRLDADGYLYLTGRVKELYKLENGKYVAPAPLEETIKRSPFVAECVYFGADQP